MRSTPKQPLAFTGIVAAAAVVLGGCFSVESNFTINDDGTADIEIVTLIDTEQIGEFTDLFGLDGGTLDGLGGADLLDELTQGDDPCADLVGSLTGFEAEVTEIDNGTEVGVGCTVSGVPIDDLNSIGADTSFSIEQDDAGTRFSAVLQGVDELTQGADDLPAFLDIDIDELFSIVFTVTAPGSLGDNNATSTNGATAEWKVTSDAAFISGGDATMTAEWTPSGGSSSNWWIIALVVVAIVVIVLLGVFLVKRRRSAITPESDGVPTDATAPPPPPSGTPIPPPPTAGPPPATTPPPAMSPPPAAAPPPPPPGGDSPPPPPPPA